MTHRHIYGKTVRVQGDDVALEAATIEIGADSNQSKAITIGNASTVTTIAGTVNINASPTWLNGTGHWGISGTQTTPVGYAYMLLGGMAFVKISNFIFTAGATGAFALYIALDDVNAPVPTYDDSTTFLSPHTLGTASTTVNIVDNGVYANNLVTNVTIQGIHNFLTGFTKAGVAGIVITFSSVTSSHIYDIGVITLCYPVSH